VAGCGIAAIAATCALNAGQFHRNQVMYGSILGPGEEADADFRARYANDAMSAPILASNLTRNLGLQLGTGNALIDHATMHGIELVHDWLGIAIDDPRTTWPGTSFEIGGASPNEDSAGNPVHLALFALAIALLVARWHPAEVPLAGAYLGALLGGMVLFAVLLRWQPWHSRLHLAGFVLSMPFIGLLLGSLSRSVIVSLLIICSAYSARFLFQNTSRPLVGAQSVLTRPWDEQMFINDIGLQSPYAESAAFSEGIGCTQIGLLIGGDDAEYPWWAFLRDGVDQPRIEHVGVQNASAGIPLVPPFEPCVILARTRSVALDMTIDSHEFMVDRAFGPISVLRPTNSGLPLDAELSASVPVQWVREQPQLIQVTLTATGSQPWLARGRSATQLSVVVSSADAPAKAPPQEVRVELPEELARGTQWTADIQVPGPSVAGSYRIRFQLVRGRAAWHPRQLIKDFSVIEPPVPLRRRSR
jgi:hypothetical protein